MNKDLYSFDKKKELFDDTKKEEKYNDTSLNAFCKFAERDGITTLGPCKLVDFLPSWGPELKINDIISTNNKKRGQDYRFLLNALDHQKLKKNLKDKNFANAYYNSILQYLMSHLTRSQLPHALVILRLLLLKFAQKRQKKQVTLLLLLLFLLTMTETTLSFVG